MTTQNHLSKFHTLQFNSKGARVDCLRNSDIGNARNVNWVSILSKSV